MAASIIADLQDENGQSLPIHKACRTTKSKPSEPQRQSNRYENLGIEDASDSDNGDFEGSKSESGSSSSSSGSDSEVEILNEEVPLLFYLGSYAVLPVFLVDRCNPPK